MIYKPENVKLVITHNGVEQEIHGITDYPINFDESTCSDDCSVVSEEQTECVLHRASKTKGVSKKAKESSQSGKQSISSTLVKQLTKSEIESLRQNKRDAYALMKYIEDTNEKS